MPEDKQFFVDRFTADPLVVDVEQEVVVRQFAPGDEYGAARQAEKNIRYTEASFMPLFHTAKGVPVEALFDMGVPIVINTDHPAFFNTTLSREYQTLPDHLGFSGEEIDACIANAFDHAFLGMVHFSGKTG